MPDAIEITPWVFGPGAAPGGRGTYESPLALAEYSSGAGHGDTLLFLPGEHRSDGTASVDGSAIIAGQGSATTVIRGDTGGFGGFRLFSILTARDTVAVRGLTIRSVPGATALYSSDGGLDVDDRARSCTAARAGSGPWPARETPVSRVSAER